MGNALGELALAEFATGGIEQQFVMEIIRCGSFQGLKKLELPTGAGKDILPAHDEVDAMSDIVADTAKLVRPLAVAVAQRKIAALFAWRLMAIAQGEVMESNLPIRDAEADGVTFEW